MKTPAALKPQAWATLAAAHDGAVELGRWGRIKTVRVPHGDWAITLDSYVVSTGKTTSTFTRLRVPIRTRTDFRMRIFRENVFARMAKWFGMSDVSVPDPEIDRKFIVQTSVASFVNTLVLDRKFASALLALPSGRLEVAPVRRRGRRVPETVELRWITGGLLNDTDKLENALKLVRATLDGLVRAGVAREMGGTE
jgi:hypothetical protein